jgi:hypothetical protein
VSTPDSQTTSVIVGLRVGLPGHELYLCLDTFKILLRKQRCKFSG